MAGSKYIYKFISSVWKKFPNQEQDRFSELWKGYEQVIGDLYQRFLEFNFTTSLAKTPVFQTERWNSFIFNSSNKITEVAKFVSFQDLGGGVNLSEKFLLKVCADGSSPVEVDCRGRNPSSTTIQEIVSKINSAIGFQFASAIFSNTIIQLQTRTVGPTARIDILLPSIPDNDATELIFGLTQSELPFVTPTLPYKYTLVDPRVQRILSLQDKIRDESFSIYWIEGPDFKVDTTTKSIAFAKEPPSKMWARITYVNAEVPYYNFGYLVDYRDGTISPADYLQNLQGLWFAYWMGPRPEFIKRALYLMFGLPVSAEDGVVLTVDSGKMTILHIDGQIRSYFLPEQLNWLLKVNDYVEKFEPLVDGIDIYDKTNFPGFVTTEIGREAIHRFALDGATVGTDPDTDESKALQALEEHTFLPQINVNAFVRPNINIGSIFTFLEGIKPLHKQFYFQVIVAVFGEELALREKVGLSINVDITPNLDINQANWSPASVRENYETLDYPPLDLDSDMIGFFERGSLSFKDITGNLPQYDVVFD